VCWLSTVALIGVPQNLVVTSKKAKKVLLHGVSGQLSGGLCAVMVSFARQAVHARMEQQHGTGMHE
jgi:hypothetical protein